MPVIAKRPGRNCDVWVVRAIAALVARYVDASHETASASSIPGALAWTCGSAA